MAAWNRSSTTPPVASRARGWPQGLLHADPQPQADYLEAFAQSGTGDDLIAAFAPDVLFLHKVENPARVADLARRFPTGADGP
jgi:hypothetical protein